MDLKRNRVEDTNDSAVISKYSMCRKGYASDPYLQYFIYGKERERSRSPLINRFYYIRFKAIEYLFKCFNDIKQIISIGCGFDTSFLRLSETSFVEIDFPFVAIKKAKILIDNQLICFNQNSVLRTDFNEIIDRNNPFVVIKTDNYCLIGADLRKYNDLKQLFIKENLLENVNNDTKVGLFNECSLCYLKQDISDNLIRVFIDLFKDKTDSITYLGFEQLRPNHPNEGFSRVMLNHFQTIGSPLKTFLTKPQIINRFKNCLNFKSIQVLDMKTFFDDYIQTNEKQRIDSLEMFDEYEEFDSVCSSYALTIAHSVQLSGDEVFNNKFTEKESKIEIISKQMQRNPLLFRFGHSSCLTKDNKIIVFGGFGCDSDERHLNNIKSSHKRLSNLIEINTKTEELIAFNSCNQRHDIKGIHSQIVELKDNLFLISGGRLSPSSVLDNKIIKLSPESQTYEIQSEIPFDCLPKVFRHLIIKNIDSNKVIQFGGKQLEYTTDEDSAYYVLDTKAMKCIKQNKRKLFTRVYSHSGISLDSNIFLMNGGLNCHTNSFASNSVYLIDERSPQINEIQVKELNHLYSHSLKLLNENKVLIIGGMTKMGANNTIDLFDIRSNEVINSFDFKSESISMLINFSSEIVLTEESSHLWLIGGGGNCFSFGTHFNELFLIDLNFLNKL